MLKTFTEKLLEIAKFLGFDTLFSQFSPIIQFSNFHLMLMQRVFTFYNDI